ncbi:uncharacterized protein A4U43_C01F5360 [Asparagus officinalis]|uniref:GBF-interacting protein 1 N-terminal domain-containing protein n=1 Tax=Asparagus officinalis TaxID=4686 RepID=A0A5P1FQR8_ASPOF|nr:GBF-interacting protein 1-like [Asparagus officinalis]ONK79339.1 uncharacterized protein A4U43_C01F5360 [Asparagus officinalis]
MSGSSSSSSRVSIPNSLRKTIQNLKEIAKNHSDDEIYAMLRECSMDPNETAQKLLLQDPFHEVKRKRDKKKEITKEPVDARWKPVSQGRVGRGGRGNYSSRYTSHDAGGERSIGKENGTQQSTDKVITSSSLPPSQDVETKSSVHASGSESGRPDGPAKDENPVPVQVSTSKNSSVGEASSLKRTSAATLTSKIGKPSRVGAKSPVPLHHVSGSVNHFLSSPKQASGSGVYSSPSDPVLVPSLDARVPGSVGTIKREVGSQRISVEAAVDKVVSRDVSGLEFSSLTETDSSEVNNSHAHEKMQGKSQEFDGNQFFDVSQSSNSLSHTSSAGSRPSSNYNNRAQQLSGPQKAVGPTKEWKPKSTNVKPAPVAGKVETTAKEHASQEAVEHSLPVSSSSLDEPTTKLQNKFGELQFSDTKHVIIPNHLRVPESARTGLSFGSFDPNFGITSSFANDIESEKGSAELSDTSQEIVENVEVQTSSVQIVSPSVQEVEVVDRSHSPEKMHENLASIGDYPQPSTEMPENLTSEEPDSSSSTPAPPEFNQSKAEAAPNLESSQYSVVHTSPTYSNFGLVPQMLGNQFAAVESSESQPRDANHIPSFLVQQPFDPASSYYNSIYRPAADGDGRFSPFFAPAPAAKYNGNVAVLPAQTGQTPQEGGNSLVLSSTGPAPLVTAGMMQTSLAVSQQSLPVFRQPPGVHLPHYAPNYLPYSQYFSPFYIPSPSMHPFLSNAAFPQQPPTGNIYPAPGAPGAAPVKYSISQYKPASNAANPSHIGVPTGYGTYNPSAVTSSSSTGTEDLASSQYKENNVYVAGQQGEGSVWIPTPGRDIPAMQATSFYNLPTQGQHLAFPGIYHHPAQAVAAGAGHPMLQQSQAMSGAVEMVGPPSGVYQQPQRTQINWVNNY